MCVMFLERTMLVCIGHLKICGCQFFCSVNEEEVVEILTKGSFTISVE